MKAENVVRSKSAERNEIRESCIREAHSLNGPAPCIEEDEFSMVFRVQYDPKL